MIEDPPLLTIRGDFPRPPPAHLASLAGVQTGFVADAMGGRGGLDHRIKPLVPLTAPLVGTAMTCHCGPADNLALFGALAWAQPGDILVAATDGFMGTAVAGDLLLGMARNRGLAGLVTDGLARDLAGIVAVGLPVFCAGLSPNSPARNGPGTVGMAVVLGGVRVESGDILVGDSDGIVVIPQSEAEAAIGRLAAVRAAEVALETEVRSGLGVPSFITSILASNRVRKLDGD